MCRKRIHVYQLVPSHYHSDVLPVMVARLANLNSFRSALAAQLRNAAPNAILVVRYPAESEASYRPHVAGFSRTKTRHVVSCAVWEQHEWFLLLCMNTCVQHQQDRNGRHLDFLHPLLPLAPSLQAIALKISRTPSGAGRQSQITPESLTSPTGQQQARVP
jgi:hypothetical protein